MKLEELFVLVERIYHALIHFMSILGDVSPVNVPAHHD